MLAHVVGAAARRWGDRSAFVAANGWSLTYGDLDRISDEVAAALARRGIGLGDVVSLALPPIPEYVIAYVAAAKVGAITAGVNPRLSPAERSGVLRMVDPDLVLTTDDLAPDPSTVGSAEVIEIAPAAAATSALRSLRALDETPPVIEEDPERPLTIVFTSGTAGPPRAVVFAERQVEFIARVDTGNRWGGGGHDLAGRSLTHLGPMTGLPGSLIRGATTHLMRDWKADDALRMVELHRMPVVGAVPGQVTGMLGVPDFDRHDLSRLAGIVIDGGPATPALVSEARERFGAAVAVRYSSTEAGIGVGTGLDAPPEDAEVSVGRPRPGVTLTIVGEDGPAPDGEVGEVCLRSSAVMSGYYRDAAATTAALTPDGSVRTGDLGHLDDRGRLHLLERADDLPDHLV